MSQSVSPLALLPEASMLRMPGLEVDSLLAQLASLGLLRSLEEVRSAWRPRLSWGGPPWCARLHLAEDVGEEEAARAANEGILSLVERFDVGPGRNVSFTEEDYREHLDRVRIHGNEESLRLAAAMTAEWPRRRDGKLVPSPFVLMFGQGHQHFLERLVDVPRGKLPKRLQKRRPAPDLNDPVKIAEALFAPWRREDETDAFRWDPTEDQRYALRFEDPSKAGAAPTVHGANRLAAVGFACLACAPRTSTARVPGVAMVRRPRNRTEFVWPVWDSPLTLSGILAMFSHPDVIEGRLEDVRALGVREIYRARRISNGKFMNITWARPFVCEPRAQRRSSR